MYSHKLSSLNSFPISFPSTLKLNEWHLLLRSYRKMDKKMPMKRDPPHNERFPSFFDTLLYGESIGRLLVFLYSAEALCWTFIPTVLTGARSSLIWYLPKQVGLSYDQEIKIEKYLYRCIFKIPQNITIIVQFSLNICHNNFYHCFYLARTF